MKISEVISKNKILKTKLSGETFKIKILSNVIVHQSKDICEFFLRNDSINADVTLGEYDNIVQDSFKAVGFDVVIVFWEAANLIDGFHYKIESLNQKSIDELASKVKSEIDLVLDNLRKTPLVIINSFTSLVFNRFDLQKSKLEKVVRKLNEYLGESIKSNAVIVDIEKIIANLSIDDATDLRYFYSSKALYSTNFYYHYFDQVSPIIFSKAGKVKKALVFDCDNTLWKGVLGEDGYENIKIYKEVQHIAMSLAKKGVILGLCSKNNSYDVDFVLDNHPDMVLKKEHITIKKVNWKDKALNIKSIANELNIGLDSIVFLDDSSFEIELIKSELPQVYSIKVPQKEYEYGLLLGRIKNLFYNSSSTNEDANKLKYYQDNFDRSQYKESIGDIGKYLKTLGIKIELKIDNLKQVSRISQMTYKTNQFNLTTKRYSEAEIKSKISDVNYGVITIRVIDKFGDNGITGLVILDFENSEIDTFLLSCRILGRDIEYTLTDCIIDIAIQKGLNTIKSEYIKTIKNTQVADFFDRCGFNRVNETDSVHQYQIQLQDYQKKNIEYIGIDYGKEN
jgi:FkbH-like protein